MDCDLQKSPGHEESSEESVLAHDPQYRESWH